MATQRGPNAMAFGTNLFVFAVLLLFAGNAVAVFPPLTQQPPTVQPTVTPVAVDPPVIITGEPGITDPGTVVTTPEPATWLTMSIGLALVAVFAWRRNRQKQSTELCG